MVSKTVDRGTAAGYAWGSISRLTIEGPDAREVQLPALVLTVDLAEVGDEEGVLLAGLALVDVDALDALAQGLADELLGRSYAMAEVVLVLVVLGEPALLQ